MKARAWLLALGAALAFSSGAYGQARPPAQKTGPITIFGSGSTGDVSGMSVTLPALPPKSLGDLLSGISAPRIYAVLYGLKADAASDQATSLTAAVAAIPASGGVLVLPCGKISLSSLTITKQNVIVEGGGQNCTSISTLNKTGDVLTLSGDYSGVRDVGFRQAGATNSNGTVANSRTSGYTVNMTGAYQFVERASFQHCYRCIRMGTTAGSGRVTQVDMTYFTSNATAAGAGGIVVDNPQLGPDNWIDHAIIYGDSGGAADQPNSRPLFGIQIANSGATKISHNDVVGFINNLRINPDTGKTAQATLVSDTYFDSAQGDNVLIDPAGTGFVFATQFVNTWLTNTNAPGNSGLKLVGLGATGNDGHPIIGTRFSNGFIVSTAPNSLNGVVCNDANVIDTTVTGTVIAGWNIGVNIGVNCSGFTVADNSIGNYSPFGLGSNNYAVALNAGSGDYISVTNNRMSGNGNNPVLNQGPTGTHNQITGNLGYNGVQNSTQFTAGASPYTYTNGPEPATIYVRGGTVQSIVAGIGGAGLASESPAVVPMGPNQSIVITHSAAPILSRVPH
jgi:hypothetical protein